jgi:hypothetical protein
MKMKIQLFFEPSLSIYKSTAGHTTGRLNSFIHLHSGDEESVLSYYLYMGRPWQNLQETSMEI